MAVALIAACRSGQPGGDEASTSDTGSAASTTGDSSTGDDCTRGAEGCPCTPGGGCDPGLVCLYETLCAPGEDEGSTSEGSGGSSSTGSGGSTEINDSTSGSTVAESSSGESETGSSSDASTTAPAPVCGDGAVDASEECDDANLDPGDGCDASCSFERWEHEGVAHDVSVSDLHKWEPCWSDTYEAGDLVSGLLDACTGDHVLLACRPLGSDTLTLAAHAPREDVFFVPQVDYDAGERHLANLVAWYFAPNQGSIGFAPAGNSAKCSLEGQVEQVCWGVGGNLPLSFLAGRRCGSEAIISGIEGAGWERVAFQSNN